MDCACSKTQFNVNESVPVSTGGPPPVGRAAMARKAIIEADARLVLSGHYHRAFSGDLPGRDLVAFRDRALRAGSAPLDTTVRAGAGEGNRTLVRSLGNRGSPASYRSILFKNQQK